MPGRLFRLIAFQTWILLGVGFCATARAQDAVVLRNVVWSIAISPRTLRVVATPAGEREIEISAAREPIAIARLISDEYQASWSLAEQGIGVSMKLEGDSLHVQFMADKPGEFVWPVVPADPSFRAYILPTWEGHYVPIDDADWIRHLSEEPLEVVGLSLPLWGIDCGNHTLTYHVTHPYNSELGFEKQVDKLQVRLTHRFTRNWAVKQYDLTISLGGPSPIEPAKRYRRWLIEQGKFVSLTQKIAATPDAAKLLGAAHVYLWGGDLLCREDVSNWKKLAAAIVEQSKQEQASIGRRIWALLDEEARQMVEKLPAAEWADQYTTGQIAEAISKVLQRQDFYDEGSWHGAAIRPEIATSLQKADLSDAQRMKLNCALFHSGFSDLVHPPQTWGDGVSTKMLGKFSQAGLDRLWLGVDGKQGLKNHPEMVGRAKELGYLVGYYDSYHSIHSPTQKDSWETAQFDQALFESGPIVRADGSKRAGFQHKGFTLSPIAAWPYVEKRVSADMNAIGANSLFMDCDAFGEVFDDYSPLHPATQADDIAARLARMSWIAKTFNAVVGSEGGVWYSAPVIHFAHGMTTGSLGWGDKEMSDRNSPYYVGAYYPPEGPAIFMKRVPLKESYIKLEIDPRYRLPLYQAAFHDSVVTTEHWGSATLKFSNVLQTRILLELLYSTPPLYHLNLREWEKQKELIRSQYEFFSPLHRRSAILPMTEFEFLSADRSVQRTRFGEDMEMIANFSKEGFEYRGMRIAAGSIVAQHGESVTVYSPPTSEKQ